MCTHSRFTFHALGDRSISGNCACATVSKLDTALSFCMVSQPHHMQDGAVVQTENTELWFGSIFSVLLLPCSTGDLCTVRC